MATSLLSFFTVFDNEAFSFSKLSYNTKIKSRTIKDEQSSTTRFTKTPNSNLLLIGPGEFIDGLGERSVERFDLEPKVVKDLIFLGKLGAENRGL